MDAALRAAAVDLGLAAAAIATRPGPKSERVRAALVDLHHAMGIDATAQPIDPDLLIERYLDAGGESTALAAAVNRHALHGATRRIGRAS